MINIKVRDTKLQKYDRAGPLNRNPDYINKIIFFSRRGAPSEDVMKSTELLVTSQVSSICKIGGVALEIRLRPLTVGLLIPGMSVVLYVQLWELKIRAV